MKQTRSLFLLFLGHSAWKLLLLLAAMAGAELALFRAMAPDPAANTLEACFTACGTPLRWVLLVAFAVFSGLLVWDRAGGHHRLRYTLDRLAVGPRTVLLCQAVYASLAFLLFWAVQALTLLGCCWLYQQQGGVFGPQTLFLACWREPLLHSFLPLEDGSLWVRNLVLVVCLGGAAACTAAQLRHQNNKTIALPVLVTLTVVNFITTMGSAMDLVLALFALIALALALANAFQLGKEEEPHETPPSD